LTAAQIYIIGAGGDTNQSDPNAKLAPASNKVLNAYVP